MITIGQVCLKIAGREAGKVCTVVKKLDTGFVLVTGPKAVTNIKRRKCSIFHLEPLPYHLELKDDASDADVMAGYEKGDIYGLLKLAKPTAEKLKAAEAWKTAPKQETKPAAKKEEKKEEKNVKKEAKPAEKK